MGDKGPGHNEQSETLTSSTAEVCSNLADQFGVVRTNKKMLRIIDYARGVAPTHYPVLIQGEEGTGKERFAGAVHELSGRRGAFVPVDCRAIPEADFEVELFGSIAGDGHEAKIGFVRAAEGGTLLLHGIDLMPKTTQAKFLRLVRDREFMPRGATAYEHADVRIIATSTRELDEVADSEGFNRSLLLELSTALIRIPPLRAREDDLFVLFGEALETASKNLGAEVPEVEPEVYQMLRDYSWPGNIRELNQVVVGATMRAKGRPLKTRHFTSLQERMEKQAPVSTPSSAAEDALLDEIRPLFVELQQFERTYIERLLKKCNNNISKAAEIAAVTRTTVREKARAHGLREGGDGSEPTPRQRIRKG